MEEKNELLCHIFAEVLRVTYIIKSVFQLRISASLKQQNVEWPQTKAVSERKEPINHHYLTESLIFKVQSLFLNIKEIS